MIKSEYISKKIENFILTCLRIYWISNIKYFQANRYLILANNENVLTK